MTNDFADGFWCAFARVVPCGENGEFHTFFDIGPVFDRAIPKLVGSVVEQGGFWFAQPTRNQEGSR